MRRFYEFTRRTFKRSFKNPKSLFHFCNLVDIDQDGFVDPYDLEYFLKRHDYIQMDQEKQEEEDQPRVFVKQQLPIVTPQLALTEDKANDVLRHIRSALDTQGVTYSEAFRLMDVNQDGFLSIDEFSGGVDKYLTLSDSAKRGFFAYMDKIKIGIIDQAQFLFVMKKSVGQKDKRIQYDSFAW